MAITLTANYKETLNAQTVEKIDELLEDNFYLDDMLEFIDLHSEEDFVSYYEEYVRCGEAIGYEAVDALIAEETDCSYIENCDDRYEGQYESVADFAEQTCENSGYSVPDFVVVDWEATWERNLRYDYTACEAGYRTVYVFRDN